MKKLILLLLIAISANAFGQNFKDQRGKIRMLYGDPMDTLTISFATDSVYYFSNSNKSHKFYSGIIADSIRLGNGLWSRNVSPWTLSGTSVYYNGGNVGINNASPAFKLDVNGDANITGSLIVGERFIHDLAEVAAYTHPDSTITTSVTTDWKFLGDGQSSKFTNIYAEGFSLDGDTLVYTQETYDTRDSVEFRLSYSCATATSNVNKTIFYGIFLKSVGEAAYRQIPQCTKKVRTASSGVYYAGAICTTIPVFLKDGDKIQIQIKNAASTSTVSTQDFGTYLYEE